MLHIYPLFMQVESMVSIMLKGQDMISFIYFSSTLLNLQNHPTPGKDGKFVNIQFCQSLALLSSNFAIVPKWTSSGPSAILKVLEVAQR